MKGKIVRVLMIVSAVVSLCACGREQDESNVVGETSVKMETAEECLEQIQEAILTQTMEEDVTSQSTSEVETVSTIQSTSDVEGEAESVSTSELKPISEATTETESQILSESTSEAESQVTLEPEPQSAEEEKSEVLPIEQITEEQKEQQVATLAPQPTEEQTQISIPASAPIPTPAPHTCSWDAGQVTTAASCNAEGILTYNCNCGQTRTEPIAKIAHNYVTEKQAPTCTTDGYERMKCSMCGDIQSENVLKATGHTLEERWFPAAPDCTYGGGMHWNDCIHCNYEETLPPGQPLGHLADEGTVIFDSDCMNPGKLSHKCVRCGSAMQNTDIPPNLNNHRWGIDEEGEFCTACGATK